MEEKVLLGVADEAMKENDDSVCGWRTNKFGGSPNWMHGPPKENLSCSVCGNSLAHVSQVYCPVHSSSYHRVLYLFACVNPRCWNQSPSWKVLRSQSLDSNCSSQQLDNIEVFGQSNEDWCDDSEDWGDSESSVAEIESIVGRLTLNADSSSNSMTSDQECAKEHASTTITTDSSSNSMTSDQECAKEHASTTITTDSSSNSMTSDQECAKEHASTTITTDSTQNESAHLSPTLTPYYVSVFEQTSHKGQTSQMSLHERELLSEYERQEGTRVTDMERSVIGSSSASMGETYEKSSLKHGDQAFYKFHKELQYCPQQCLRYMWDGKPLTISGKDAAALKNEVPNCQYCGGKRVYELQLMPALVHLLKGTNTTHQPIHNCKFQKQQIHLDTKDGEKRSDSRNLSPEGLNEGYHELESQKGMVKQPFSAHSAVRVDSYSVLASCLSQETSCLNDNYTQLRHSGELNSQDFSREESDLPVDIAPVIAEETLTAPGEELLGVLTSKNEATVEFGTVIVYTCSNCCWTESCGNMMYREEFALVEPDPDSDLFK